MVRLGFDWIRALAAACAIAATAAPAAAQDHSRIYTAAEIDADAERLETAFRKIFELGVKPALTPTEREALKNLQFSFPKPRSGDFAMDFYTYQAGGRNYVVAPILSLKALEDLTTAFAWLYSERLSLEPIDLYYAMIRRADPSGFPGGRYPAILPTLGVPADAYEHAPVDKLSLSLRNEAFAFILIHELGHIVFEHKGYDEITVAQARADETDADRFAFDVLARTGTSAMGATVFFQAQAYSLPNRGQFASEKAWLDFLYKRSTHPLTTDRLRAMARYAAVDMPRARPGEREIWTGVGRRLEQIVAILEDRELQDCIAVAAERGRVEVLKPGARPSETLFREFCL